MISLKQILEQVIKKVKLNKIETLNFKIMQNIATLEDYVELAYIDVRHNIEANEKAYNHTIKAIKNIKKLNDDAVVIEHGINENYFEIKNRLLKIDSVIDTILPVKKHKNVEVFKSFGKRND